LHRNALNNATTHKYASPTTSCRLPTQRINGYYDANNAKSSVRVKADQTGESCGFSSSMVNEEHYNAPVYLLVIT
jgi:hypothetical protein